MWFGRYELMFQRNLIHVFILKKLHGIASQQEITFTFYSIPLYTLKKIHVHHSIFLVYIYSRFLRSLF